jgi:hypothetical protein
MIKLILYRVLPLVAGVGIVGAAVSPVQGTLELFGAAADALAGDTHIETSGGIQVDTSQLPTVITGIEKPKKTVSKKQSLQKLAEKAEKGEAVSDAENYGWEEGDRAMKPIEPPRKK